MTAPLPGPLGGTDLIAWRLDASQFAATWDSGEGAYRFGGRWSSAGTRAVYCALDASTTILEVAVHRGFKRMDTIPHVLTSLRVLDPRDVYVVEASVLPNASWLRPGIPSAGQQAFGDALLRAHPFVLVPSVVSTNSWNLVFIAAQAVGRYALRSQEGSALDTRLHPPK
ncbi:RES family NAD+ phosphorylase [Devosia ginsengisoli]|uniref:RES domain-containing protein n=1 Tax=Devosia ginsengisoli TaxID=400770 RepID=A0A5B8LRN0_9HYPH|nr:RES domain-containing protein [Devosia ginsengisoli]QDZ10581.1 RES domain-containing protein [Devosia ginsengisoli]